MYFFSWIPARYSPNADEAVLSPGRLPTLEEAEDALIREALRRAQNSRTIAAELLGLSRRALNDRLRRREPGTEH